MATLFGEGVARKKRGARKGSGKKAVGSGAGVGTVRKGSGKEAVERGSGTGATRTEAGAPAVADGSGKRAAEQRASGRGSGTGASAEGSGRGAARRSSGAGAVESGSGRRAGRKGAATGVATGSPTGAARPGSGKGGVGGGSPRAAVPTELERLTGERYRTYALSVITSRALPDVRDGLKPVQRRILTTMWRQGLRSGGRFRKSAKVVGDVMGALHPHGDAAIYDALARMAQPFSTRLPLIEGSGNFGSLDGDPPAAMRYTECRLAEAADEVLGDIAADTVDHRPTYDGSGSEPVVLPTRLPLLLVNGCTGIAVGVATSIPPHNLVEILDALIRLLDEPGLDSGALAGIVRGPDFPTGGEILDPPERLARIYAEGRGAVRVRGTVEDAGVRQRVRTLFITSIPWGVNKAQLVERLGEIVADRSLPALLEVSDLSTDDVRIRLEVRKEADPAKVIAFLGRRTRLVSPVPFDLTCLRFERSPGGAPERVGLRTLLLDFLAFRREVARRRLEHEQRRLARRLHLLAGFARVFDALDRVLEIVRASNGKADAARKIIARIGLDAEQTDAVLELRIYRLARLEIRVIREEMDERGARLAEVERLLASPEAITAEVRAEFVAIRDRRAAESARRTRFAGAEPDADFADEDFLPDEDGVLILSRDGWIRRQREVREPGKLRLREGDELLALAPGSTRASFVLFSSFGRAFTARFAAVPATTGHGVPVQKLFALGDGEKIVSLVSLDPRALERAIPAGEAGELAPHGFAVTRGGNALRFRLEAFSEPSNRNGRRFARLVEDDRVLGAALTRGVETLIVATRSGRALLCDIEEINLLAGAGRGVRAVRLSADDAVLGFRVARRGERLTAETPGGGRRVIAPGEKFRVGARGGLGTLVNKAGFVRAPPAAIAPPEPFREPLGSRS